MVRAAAALFVLFSLALAGATSLYDYNPYDSRVLNELLDTRSELLEAKAAIHHLKLQLDQQRAQRHPTAPQQPQPVPATVAEPTKPSPSQHSPSIQQPPSEPCSLCSLFPLIALMVLVPGCARGALCLTKVVLGVSAVGFLVYMLYLPLALLASLASSTLLALLLVPTGIWLVPVCFALIACLASRSSCSSRSWCSPCWRRSPVPEGDCLPAAPLRHGAQGPGVAQLQHALIQLDLMHRDAIRFCAGFYGPRTHTAIAELQRTLGVVEPTGCYDAAVRQHLQAELLKKQQSSHTSPTEATPTDQPIHWGITCDRTEQSPIVGVRYHKRGYDYDLCEAAFLKLSDDEKKAYERIEQPNRGPWFMRGHLPSMFFRGGQSCCRSANGQSSPACANEGTSEQPVSASKPVIAEAPQVALPKPVIVITEAPSVPQHIVERSTELQHPLLAMGFDHNEVAAALDATQGSLERAAEWLIVARSAAVESREVAQAVEAVEAKVEPKEPELPERCDPEFDVKVKDLVAMGFVTERAREVLLVTEGNVKEAVKALVAAERAGRAPGAM